MPKSPLLDKPLILILLGPPGSGKGTQAALLKEKLSLPHISTGDLLREQIRQGTKLGKLFKSYMDQGKLGPDSLMLEMLFERISHPDCSKGCILDGFPRTLPQAEALQKRLSEHARIVVISLEISDSSVIERLTNRLTCEACSTPFHLIYSPPKNLGRCDKCGGKLIQRIDDAEDVITQRLRVYHDQTAPLIHYYRSLDLLHSVPCDLPKEAVLNRVLALI